MMEWIVLILLTVVVPTCLNTIKRWLGGKKKIEDVQHETVCYAPAWGLPPQVRMNKELLEATTYRRFQ